MGLSKFRGPDDENFRRAAFAIQKIIEDKEPNSWYGTGSASEAELEDILTRNGLVQHSSQPLARKRKKKPTRKRSLKVGASSPTSETPRSDETTADQGNGDVAHPDVSYLEPYRRVSRIPTPPTDDLRSADELDGSRASSNPKNALFGALGIVLGAAADSLYRSKAGRTSGSGGGVLANMMPGISSPLLVLVGRLGEFPEVADS